MDGKVIHDNFVKEMDERRMIAIVNSFQGDIFVLLIILLEINGDSFFKKKSK